MKNWKDKVLGIFAGIGIMSLLMGFQQGNTNDSLDVSINKLNEDIGKTNEGGRYTFQVISYIGSSYGNKVRNNLIFTQDNQTGEVWFINPGWKKENRKWNTAAAPLPSDLKESN